MVRVERGDEPFDSASGPASAGERLVAGDRQLVGLPVVAHVGVAPERDRLRRMPSSLQLALAPPPAALRRCASPRTRSAFSVGTMNGAIMGWRMSVMSRPTADVMPGCGGTTTRGMLGLASDRAGVHRSGAAEGDQAEVARIETLLDGDHADRAEHVGVGDRDDARGGVLDREAEGLGDVLARRRRERPSASSAQVAAEDRVARRARRRRGWRRRRSPESHPCRSRPGPGRRRRSPGPP